MGRKLRNLLVLVALGAAGSIQAQTISAVIGGDIGDGGPAVAAGLGKPVGVTTDEVGNIFVSDAAHFRVRKIDALTGLISTVAGTGYPGSDGDGGAATSAALEGPRGLEVADGMLYIADLWSGIRRVDLATGKITTVLGGTGQTSRNYHDVAIGPDGDLYYADRGDGNTGGGVGRLNLTTGIVTPLAGTGVRGFSGDQGPALSAQVDEARSIAVDAQGNVYFSDFSNGRIRKIDVTTGTIETIAGDGTWNYEGVEGPARYLPLAGPEGIDVDAEGNIYIAENTMVRRIDAVSGLITRIAGEGSNGNTAGDGQALAVRLDGAAAVDVGPDGTVLVAVERNYNVRRIDPLTGTIETAAGVGIGDGGLGEAATLVQPARLALGPEGIIYIADAGHNRIRRYDPKTGVIQTYAGNGSLSFGGDGGPATEAIMARPSGVAATDDGYVFIADTWANRIRKVTVANGLISSAVGNGASFQVGPTYNGDNIQATAAWINSPADVATTDDALYISDAGNHRIRRVDLTTQIITTVAGTGTASSSGDTGPATSAAVNNPSGLCVDAAGNLYIADTGGNRIRRVDPQGVITTIAGLGVAGYAGDGGPAQAARLSAPEDVVADGAGNLYIADTGNHVVRRIDAATGAIATLAGDGQQGYDGIGGPPAEARLGSPSGLLIDEAGSLYISDRSNHAVFVIATDNTAPVIAVDGTSEIAEGQTVQLDVSATDDDGDAVMLSIRNAPFGSVFSNNHFAWTPGYTQQGVYDVTFLATDARGGSASTTVRIEVSDVLSLSEQAIDFGTVLIDSTGTAVVTVHNDGAAAIELGISTNLTEFVASPASTTLAAGATTDIDVAFTPTSSLAREASLLLAVGGQLTALSVELSGQGQLPAVSVSPQRLDFGQVGAGATASRVLTITNAGSQVLSISNVVPGNPQFSVSTASFSLNTGSSRDITVSMTSTAGQAVETTLTLLTSDAAFPSLTVPMSVLSATDTPPSISVFPGVINFGSVALGQTKSLQLYVSNAGGGSLRLVNLVASSADVTLSSTSFSLTGGAEEVVTLTLQPTRLGSFTQTLDIPSNDPSNPFLQVPLRATITSGTGQPTLDLSVTILDFGQVAEGETSRFTLPIRNSGTSVLTVSNAVSDNTQVVPSPTSLSIPPQETRSLTVSFRPLPGRGRTGKVTIFSDDTQRPLVDLTWSASDVASPFLKLESVSPGDGDFAVNTNETLRLRFDEPLFHRRGYTALDLELRPMPLSGPLLDNFEVRGDGSTIEFPVELEDNTIYRLVVYGATGTSGLELFDIQEITFSTANAPPVFGTLAGVVTTTVPGGIEGSVYIYDDSAQLVAQTPISLDGSFSFAELSEGSYRIYADGAIEDGRSLGGSWDEGGDGLADLLFLQAGDVREDLEIHAAVRDVTDPSDTGARILADLDPASGNQRLTTRWQTTSGDTVVLEAHVSGAALLTGTAVEVTWDTTAFAYLGAEQAEHALTANGGTALFLSDLDPAEGTVSFGGSILGPTDETAVSGSGLLGRYTFLVLDGFNVSSQLAITGVTLKSLDGRLRLESPVTTTLSSGNGPVASPITVDLNPATGDQAQDRRGSAAPGEIYTLQLFVTDAPQITGWSATIEFDPVQVAYVAGSFTPSTFLPGLIPLVDARSDRVSLGGATLGTGTGAEGDGYLGSVEVEILPNFSGSTQLSMRQISLNTVASGEQIQSVQVSVELTDEVLDNGLPADYNHDGVVDFSDFFAFADAFGTTSAEHDLSGDGIVDFSDFFLFADYFGTEERGKLLALAQEMIGLPVTPMLLSGYPNPFNSQITIPFVLANPSSVEVIIYDLAGQVVRQLLMEERPAGLHNVQWDATNSAGTAVATGVYLVRLATGEGAWTGRMLLLR